MTKDIYLEHGKKVAISCFSAFLCALSMNLFLIPAQVYASGINGAAQLAADLIYSGLHFRVSISLLILLLNLPIAFLGWYKVGKTFTFYSFVTVILTSLFLGVIPVSELSNDLLLNAIFGGIISAVGVGVALKFGISTGGLDIIAIYLTRKWRKSSTGRYFMTLNGIIILIAGFVYQWQYALYTLISRYVNSYVIDNIHTKYQKLTIIAVTEYADTMVDAIQTRFDRGATVTPSYGGYSKKKLFSIMIVVSHYELYEMEKLIKHIDPQAFINILETTKIVGVFHSEEEQRAVQAMKERKVQEKKKLPLSDQEYEKFKSLIDNHNYQIGYGPGYGHYSFSNEIKD
ncbi:YitT family protein [Terrilactibacillus laevilacticus]|uniref:YitT family protein n=1 Tax=Terrilactibacillus laevilacticus TaxID=1380157 RepID=A0ABW5PU87_9BACI|nr:YitT family protein [Terrilactibacillus laevilacticus]